MVKESFWDRRVSAEEPPKLGRLGLLRKDSLSNAQRNYLQCYLKTKNKEITAAFAFRFYVRYLLFCAIVTGVLSVLALLLVPAATVCSLRYSFVAVLVAMFLTQLLYLAWQATASVEHWRLLQSIIDWDAVARLTDDEASPDSPTDQRPE